jgi:predicted secreted protein
MQPTSNNHSVNVNSGDEFDIILDETPTSGYIWIVQTCPAEILLLEDTFLQRNTQPVVGDTGHRRFHFRTTQPGQFVINFHLKRTWENTPLKSFTVDVSVH